MPDSNKFHFSSSGIGSIFLKRLEVPKYQRDYSWEKEQINLLLEDLDRAKSDSAEYFLGTIVTISLNDGDLLEIVDGQQRLTTTTILLSAFREYAEHELNSELLVRSIEDDFLFTIDREAEERVSRLSLNIDDDSFFKQLIDPEVKDRDLEPKRRSHELLIESKKLCKTWLRTKMTATPQADRLGLIKEWLKFIERKATVILVETGNASQAFKMFETLNDRGLRTSQADLVKSYLFGQSDKKIDQAQARWSSMLENISEVPDDDRVVNFLRHALIATTQFVRTQDVYDVTSKKIRGKSSSLIFLSKLESLSKTYVATFNSDAALWKSRSVKTRRAIATFNKFNLQPMRPLLLSLAEKFSQKEFEKSILLLVSLSVRMVISSRTRSGANEQAFAGAALAAYEGNIKNLIDLKNSLSGVMVTDREFGDAFSKASSSKADLSRYYLRSLESAASNEKEPWYVPNDDQTEINLEHILPKNPDVNAWKSFDSEIHKIYYRRIGNLCLLRQSDNSHDGNSAFSVKKQTFSKASYELTKSVASYKKWDPKSIEKRQDELKKLALKAWPL